MGKKAFKKKEKKLSITDALLFFINLVEAYANLMLV
jgi:hypothetical protein